MGSPNNLNYNYKEIEMSNTLDLKEQFFVNNQISSETFPTKVYYEGDDTLLYNERRVSVIGSRKVSDFGIRRTQYITEKLVKQNIIIVSGMAEGVDTIAHHTAIRNGRTIAVLGTPLDQVYPKSNKNLFEIIKTNHLVISQFETNHPIQKSNFPQRNRTMALISDATFIIEATEKSGTRHQGWEALRLGRTLYVLENVVQSTKWAKEMLQYGAVMLTNKMLQSAIEDIPYSTSKYEYEF